MTFAFSRCAPLRQMYFFYDVCHWQGLGSFAVPNGQHATPAVMVVPVVRRAQDESVPSNLEVYWQR
jgi:hypothetical protein